MTRALGPPSAVALIRIFGCRGVGWVRAQPAKTGSRNDRQLANRGTWRDVAWLIRSIIA